MQDNLPAIVKLFSRFNVLSLKKTLLILVFFVLIAGVFVTAQDFVGDQNSSDGDNEVIDEPESEDGNESSGNGNGSGNNGNGDGTNGNGTGSTENNGNGGGNNGNGNETNGNGSGNNGNGDGSNGNNGNNGNRNNGNGAGNNSNGNNGTGSGNNSNETGNNGNGTGNLTGGNGNNGNGANQTGTGGGNGNVSGNGTDEGIDVPIPNPGKLEIELSHPDKLTRGEEIELSAVIENVGDKKVKDVVINWNLPSHFEIVSGSVIEDLGDVDGGEIYVISVNVVSDISSSLGINEIGIGVSYKK